MEIDENDVNPLLIWNCSSYGSIPSVEQIDKIHIYDFDNTIFRSPAPNPSLYAEATLNMLVGSEDFNGGGWWSNPLTLKNVGEGWQVERARQWEGFWNEDILELIKLSNEDKRTMTVIMTGRKKIFFVDLIEELLRSRDIEYDALILKQGAFGNTLEFKTQVMVDLLEFYSNVNEISIYDDRKYQLNGFQSCLNEFAEAVKPNLSYSLIPVFLQPSFLDPLVEKRLVQEYLNNHNDVVESGKSRAKQGRVELKQSVFFSAYILDTESKARLIELLIKNYPSVFNDDTLQTVRFQPHFIAITQSKLAARLEADLKKASPIEWKVTHFGFNSEKYAVQVESLTPGFYPTIVTPAVLAVAGYGKAHDSPISEFLEISDWEPVTDPIVVTTHYGLISKFRTTETKSRKK